MLRKGEGKPPLRRTPDACNSMSRSRFPCYGIHTSNPKSCCLSQLLCSSHNFPKYFHCCPDNGVCILLFRVFILPRERMRTSWTCMGPWLASSASLMAAAAPPAISGVTAGAGGFGGGRRPAFLSSSHCNSTSSIDLRTTFGRTLCCMISTSRTRNFVLAAATFACTSETKLSQPALCDRNSWRSGEVIGTAEARGLCGPETVPLRT